MIERIHGIDRRKLFSTMSSYHGAGLDPSACCRIVEPLGHSVGQAGDFAVQPPIVATKDAQDLWKGEHHLSVRKPK